MKKSSFLVALCLFLAACAGSPKFVNPLTPDVRDSIFIKEVAVDMSALDTAAKSDEPLSEDKIEIRRLFDVQLKDSILAAFQNGPAGTDPVTAVVNVSKLGTDKLSARVDIVRIRNGERLASYDIDAFASRSGFLKLVQGKGSKVNQVVEEFTATLHGQLLK